MRIGFPHKRMQLKSVGVPSQVLIGHTATLRIQAEIPHHSVLLLLRLQNELCLLIHFTNKASIHRRAWATHMDPNSLLCHSSNHQDNILFHHCLLINHTTITDPPILLSAGHQLPNVLPLPLIIPLMYLWELDPALGPFPQLLSGNRDV